MCRAAYAAGTRKIVATPHVNWDYPGVSAAVVHAGVLALNQALAAAPLDLEIRSGAEIALSRAAELTDSELELLRLGAGPYVLVELSDSAGGAGIENALRMVSARGHRVVIAHPERSAALRRDPDLVQRLVGSGILCCVTARALSGRSGGPVQAFAWELLGARLGHVIASDAHDAGRRAADLGLELERAGLESSQIDYFTRVTPLAIIEGRPLVAPPSVTRPRLGRRRWFPHRSSAAR